VGARTDGIRARSGRRGTGRCSCAR
jgi:hypothetical protein